MMTAMREADQAGRHLSPRRCCGSHRSLRPASSAQAAPVVGGADVADFTLANRKLEVVVIPDHRTPVVTHMVWYKVGSADETPRPLGPLPISSSI